jgi:gliding motility-associated-like protein
LNPTGCNATADTTNLIIIVKNDSIHASFTAVKKDSCQPFTAIMNNTSTTNGTTNHNPNTTFTWDFGDGSGLYTGQNPPLHSFPSNGIYTITLTMVDTNSCNGSSSATFVVNYTSTFVAAAFDIPDSLCMPAFITYLDQSTNASTWSWTFGDNNTSNLSNPTNTYVAPGVYNVTLVAGNPATCNKLDTASQTISVFTSPIADFTWSPNPPTPNTPNKFTNLSTGATKYLWDFGDGTSSTNKDEVHVYFADGYYTVCLTATNAYGCRDTACKTVRGLVLPLVDVPTGFSPNGDGINDVVYVKGYGIQKMAFKIFNRWGEKIFETNDISVGWDGRYKGILQEMEVYGYTLSVTFFDGSKDFKKGNITLLK